MIFFRINLIKKSIRGAIKILLRKILTKINIYAIITDLSSQSIIQKYLKNIGVKAIVKTKEVNAKEIIENEEWLPIKSEDIFKESLVGFKSQSYFEYI